MPTIATAAIAAVTFAGLYAGHQIGDHPAQPHTAAAAKGAPTADLLAAGVHPWTGWISGCARHVALYILTQAAALALVAVVAPLTWAGSTAALATSASTHATIDRRWLVRLIIRAKGCQDWAEAPYLLDQSLHVGALLIAAVLAAAVTSAAGAAVVTGAGGVLIAATLLAERVQATAARRHPVSPYRL